jgi:hypothetical protein
MPPAFVFSKSVLAMPDYVDGLQTAAKGGGNCLEVSYSAADGSSGATCESIGDSRARESVATCPREYAAIGRGANE